MGHAGETVARILCIASTDSAEFSSLLKAPLMRDDFKPSAGSVSSIHTKSLANLLPPLEGLYTKAFNSV
jgi:hypothetical protein